MNWEKNLKFISFIMRFISFYKFLVTVVKMVSVSFSRDLENRTIEDDKSENYVAEDVTDVVAKLIADWAINTGVVILDSH